MKDQWYYSAIIYALDVETYMDFNGDGIGDFKGLVSKLDHLSGLGVNCLWLRPFYPSPLADDGYDVSDYYNIDPRLGNLGDFVDFVVKANALGLKIIIDLVVNHTSEKHEWFQKSRRDRNSKYRNFYIWKDELTEEDTQHENILKEESIWEYDDVAEAYYMHHFLKEQPDLNISNPEVRAEIKKIMGFWIQLGVSGFRIDSANIMVHASKNQVYGMLDEMREFINIRNHEAVLLAEANVEPGQLQEFFGTSSNSRLHLLFNFNSNKNMFLSLAKKNAKDLRNSINEVMEINGGWVNFLRTHDELTLDMLSEPEREEVFKAFAPDEDMRLFGRGIRRRLPPMLNGDRKRLELIFTVMFSLPGIPLINYGEEIAMGDDLSQPGRSSVRTVMQWDNLKNAGFSTAASENLVHPVIDFGEYNYQKVNVSAQLKDPDTFLNWIERLISTRKHSPQLSFGHWSILNCNTDYVLSFFVIWKSDIVLLLLNFKDEDCRVKLNEVDVNFGRLSEIFSNKLYDEVNDIKSEIEISAYGYRWFKSNVY